MTQNFGHVSQVLEDSNNAHLELERTLSEQRSATEAEVAHRMNAEQRLDAEYRLRAELESNMRHYDRRISELSSENQSLHNQLEQQNHAIQEVVTALLTMIQNGSLQGENLDEAQRLLNLFQK